MVIIFIHFIMIHYLVYVCFVKKIYHFFLYSVIVLSNHFVFHSNRWFGRVVGTYCIRSITFLYVNAFVVAECRISSWVT
jgi:hypothetical protein